MFLTAPILLHALKTDRFHFSLYVSLENLVKCSVFQPQITFYLKNGHITSRRMQNADCLSKKAMVTDEIFSIASLHRKTLFEKFPLSYPTTMLVTMMFLFTVAMMQVTMKDGCCPICALVRRKHQKEEDGGKL